MATALIEEYYLNLLHAGRCEGNVYYLPEEVGLGKPGQLSRESYVAVNEIITRIGGRWNRKLGGHVFEVWGMLGYLVAAQVLDIIWPWRGWSLHVAIAAMFIACAWLTTLWAKRLERS
jgi:hypothetical protein